MAELFGLNRGILKMIMEYADMREVIKDTFKSIPIEIELLTFLDRYVGIPVSILQYDNYRMLAYAISEGQLEEAKFLYSLSKPTDRTEIKGLFLRLTKPGTIHTIKWAIDEFKVSRNEWNE